MRELVWYNYIRRQKKPSRKMDMPTARGGRIIMLAKKTHHPLKFLHAIPVPDSLSLSVCGCPLVVLMLGVAFVGHPWLPCSPVVVPLLLLSSVVIVWASTVPKKVSNKKMKQKKNILQYSPRDRRCLLGLFSCFPVVSLPLVAVVGLFDLVVSMHVTQ